MIGRSSIKLFLAAIIMSFPVTTLSAIRLEHLGRRMGCLFCRLFLLLLLLIIIIAVVVAVLTLFGWLLQGPVGSLTRRPFALLLTIAALLTVITGNLATRTLRPFLLCATVATGPAAIITGLATLTGAGRGSHGFLCPACTVTVLVHFESSKVER